MGGRSGPVHRSQPPAPLKGSTPAPAPEIPYCDVLGGFWILDPNSARIHEGENCRHGFYSKTEAEDAVAAMKDQLKRAGEMARVALLPTWESDTPFPNDEQPDEGQLYYRSSRWCVIVKRSQA